LEDRQFYWPHVVTFPPKSQVDVLVDTPVVAQRMYDRVGMLSAGCDVDKREKVVAEKGVQLSRTPEEEKEVVVLQVMRAVTAHFPINHPGLLEPLVRHVARVLDNTPTCFYFFWWVTDNVGDGWHELGYAFSDGELSFSVLYFSHLLGVCVCMHTYLQILAHIEQQLYGEELLVFDSQHHRAQIQAEYIS
jgi:hypothetical protein